jgi:glutaredoxin 3
MEPVRVVVYSKVGCGYCTIAKSLLEENDVAFEEHVLDPAESDYAERVSELKARTCHPTFPQIFIDDEFIGGHIELVTSMHKLVQLGLTDF